MRNDINWVMRFNSFKEFQVLDNIIVMWLKGEKKNSCKMYKVSFNEEIDKDPNKNYWQQNKIFSK